jgi:hypothetical protein
MKKISSILKLKCPQCSKGDLFVKPGLFRYKDILNMPEKCNHCDQIFELEPGFWIGALWTSYPIIVILELPFLILAISSRQVNLIAIIITMILVLVIFYPLILRLGRSIWIHIFVSKKNIQLDK